MVLPKSMPIISRNVPAYTNDDFSGSFPASNANNSTYGGQNYWRCVTTPTANANSGTLTQAVYLAYDLSGVASTQRQNIVVVWYNDPTTDPYNANLLGTNYFNSPSAYTIDINTAAGGSLPNSGWVTKVTETSQFYHSRQYAFTMSGANWIRINVTAIFGSVANNNVSLNMDVHDAHAANQDNFIFFGDSITQRGFDHDDIVLGPILPAQINAKRSNNFPIIENGGMGGFKAQDVANNNYLASWLPLFTGKYVGLIYGTNDANAGGSPVSGFQTNMQTLITAVINNGNIPIIPKTIPYGLTAGVQANGPTVNTALAALAVANPTAIVGPDLWTYFQNNQSLISGDNLHPTDPAGYLAYRAQWANALLSTIYSSGNNVFVKNRHFAKVLP